MSRIIDLHIIDRKWLKHLQERTETPLGNGATKEALCKAIKAAVLGG